MPTFRKKRAEGGVAPDCERKLTFMVPGYTSGVIQVTGIRD
jgi:hypothetical protein